MLQSAWFTSDKQTNVFIFSTKRGEAVSRNTVTVLCQTLAYFDCLTEEVKVSQNTPNNKKKKIKSHNACDNLHQPPPITNQQLFTGEERQRREGQRCLCHMELIPLPKKPHWKPRVCERGRKDDTFSFWDILVVRCGGAGASVRSVNVYVEKRGRVLRRGELSGRGWCRSHSSSELLLSRE